MTETESHVRVHYSKTMPFNATHAILEEKNDLQRALFTVQEALQTSTGEKEQLHKLFTDIKH